MTIQIVDIPAGVEIFPADMPDPQLSAVVITFGHQQILAMGKDNESAMNNAMEILTQMGKNS